MPRPQRSEVTSLLQEARALEMLMSEAEVSPERLPLYWDLSAELMTLVLDIEEYGATNPQPAAEDPAVFALKRKLRDIASRLIALTLD